MTPPVAHRVHPAPFTLADSDAEHLLRVARNLCAAGSMVDDARWIGRVREAFEDAPASFRKMIRAFRRHTGPAGVLLLRGLPVQDDAGRLGRTPRVEGSVQRTPTLSAAVLLLAAGGLGDPAGFRQEKSGALVHDVVPVPGREELQGNAGSVPLSWHIENAFHPHRPDFVVLSCLRSDHDGVATLRTACIRAALPLLDTGTRDALACAEFSTAAPPSFGGDEGGADGSGEPHPVLSGAGDDPDLRVDLAATRPLTGQAKAALAELEAALDRVSIASRLAPGDLVVVDNRTTVHGRSAFRPRYDGADRWLQRTYVLADLRRSRRFRSSDGYVIAE